MRTQLEGPALAAQTCARRLAPLGVEWAEGRTREGRSLIDLEWPGGNRSQNRCAISWYGPDHPEGDASEAVVQAMSGLMYLHGRDLGGPRRLGVEIASVAAGVLAAHAVVASAIGHLRGGTFPSVQTSVLQAGLLQASHYFAAATTGEEWVPAPPADSPGPPFRSSDGKWFEIETLDPDTWLDFWARMGLDRSDIGRGWALFRPRYYRGTTSLPRGFHEAAAARPLSELAELAGSLGVSLCPVRSYDEVLAHPGRDASHPLVSAPPAPAAKEDEVAQAAGPRASSDAGRGRTLPLEGITVVEATNRLQGPLAGLLLQMLGAHVVRVEPPGGDLGRAVPPLADGTGSFFRCFNRGKTTVEIDLGHAPGRAELADLGAGAEVFLHNWRPGNARKWGLAPDDLCRRNPGLVYTEASGWAGTEGTAELVGTDFLVQAYAGIGNGLHPEPDPPAPSRVLLTDFMGALITCEGVLAGLYRRETQGRGSWVRTSLLAGGMALQAHVLDALAEDREQGRHKGRPVWGPLDQPVETQNGSIVLSTIDNGAFNRLCKACEVEPGAGDPHDLEVLVARQLGSRPAHHWVRVLTNEGIACAVVATDLAALPLDDRFSALFEPLSSTSKAPATPWTFLP